MTREQQLETVLADILDQLRRVKVLEFEEIDPETDNAVWAYTLIRARLLVRDKPVRRVA